MAATAVLVQVQMRIWRYSWQGRVAADHPTEVADGAASMAGADKGSYEGVRVGELGDSLCSGLSCCLGFPWYVPDDCSRATAVTRIFDVSLNWLSGMVVGIGLREGEPLSCCIGWRELELEAS